MPGLRDLLDGQEGRVDTPVIGRLVLLFDDRKQNALCFLERQVLLFLDDALQLVEGVDGDDVPASSKNLLDGIKAVGSTLFLIVGLDEKDIEILEQQSVPGLYLHQERVENGSLTLHVRMAPLEIRMVEVE